MRILVVMTSLPFPATNGATMRSSSVLKALAGLGHEMHLLVLDEKQPADNYEYALCTSFTVIEHKLPSTSASSGNLRRLHNLPYPLPYGTILCRSGKMKKAISELCFQMAIDVIWYETLDASVNLPPALKVPIVINTQNVEHLILARYLQNETSFARRLYAWLEYKKMQRWEKQACQKADLVLACSEDDRAKLQTLCPRTPIYIVPNIIDTSSYSEYENREKNNRVLYMGGMDWYPNRDAVEFFAFQVLPRLREMVPEVEFVVAGRNPPKEFRAKLESEAGVNFTGTVADMRPQIAQAAVCVVPLRIGSGTRLKILEAGAMSKAIVSTHIGAEGLRFVDGEEIVLVDEPIAFANATSELLRDQTRRRRIGCAARQRVQRDYSFEQLKRSLAECLQGSVGWVPKNCGVAIPATESETEMSP